MTVFKKCALIIAVCSLMQPVYPMESDSSSITDRLLQISKDTYVPAIFCAGFALGAYLLVKSIRKSSSLTVYNMNESMIMQSFTSPQSLHASREHKAASISPYQSFWSTNAVTFTCETRGIETFYWRHIASPWYRADIKLALGENATLEVHANGTYRFKGVLHKATSASSIEYS